MAGFWLAPDNVTMIEFMRSRTVAEVQKLWPGASWSPQNFLQLHSSSSSEIMANHSKQLALGFTAPCCLCSSASKCGCFLRSAGIFVSGEAKRPLPNALLPKQVKCFSPCGPLTLLPAPEVSPLLSTRALPGIELQNLQLCSPLFIES